MFITNLYRSSVGKKAIMGTTGLIGIGFLIAHMAGNLQAFISREKYNAYSAMLQGPLKEVVWILRLVLVASVVLHIVMAFQLSARNRAARPVGYEKQRPQASTLASRTMLVGGLLILLFIPFHLMHFTGGQVDPAHAYHGVDEAGRHDVYGNIVASFHIPWVTAFYVVTMIAIGMHLFHGAWSSVRTLGLVKPSRYPLHKRVAVAVAAAVWLGFTLVPFGVLFGVIR